MTWTNTHLQIVKWVYIAPFLFPLMALIIWRTKSETIVHIVAWTGLAVFLLADFWLPALLGVTITRG